MRSTTFLSFLTVAAGMSVPSSSERSKHFSPKLTAKWIQLEAPITTPRSGHVSFVIDMENQKNLYVFGGYTEQNHLQSVRRYPINDLNKLNLPPNPQEFCQNENNNWENIEQLGDVPSKRLVSAAVVLNER